MGRRVAGSEFVDGEVVVDFSRSEDCGGEVGLVGGVGELLRLKAEAVVAAVGRTAAALHAVEVVACVKLHAGLITPDRHPPPARGLVDARNGLQAVGAKDAAHHKVVVVAHAVVSFLDLGADFHRFPQIHRALDEPHFAGGDGGGVDGRVEVGRKLNLVVQHVGAPAVFQIPVRVVRQIHKRRLVGDRGVLDPQLVGRRE
mmetsp:Transcript_25577/g.55986  ORF Transcript_25577/g.55986 Transcript_25577/m.55986 type:complete len:200 (-) Transcript_25577:139-738(-)